jgi:hypothetical protein
MNKAILSVLIVTLASLASGCSYISKFIEARKEIEEQEVRPISVEVNTSEKSEEEIFTDLEESEEAEPLIEVAGLVPATDPDVRARLAERGRNDPFSVISIPSKIEVEQEDTVAINPNNRPNRPPDSTNTPIRRNSEPNLPEFPPVNPTLAQNVQILGLYEPPNGATKLIVQAPEESNSHYVEVGQYLSNGEVLVKSIDRNHYPYPQVILEQSGIEVFKAIGEDPNENTEDLS